MPLDIVIIRLLLAVFVGGVIGAEREYRNKSAGFRTMIMISLGSCIFTLCSIYIGQPGNADRIASNIVTGIGFLGAGIIFKADDRVRGLTTAATIWFTAALGIGVGSGHYVLALAGSGMAMLILGLFTLVEHTIDKLHEIRTYRIVCDYNDQQLKYLEETFHRHHLKSTCGKKWRKDQQLTSTWKVRGKTKNHHLLLDELMNDSRIIEIES
jgi:putative Mg2+ transporter-C (MgtC) family protein